MNNHFKIIQDEAHIYITHNPTKKTFIFVIDAEDLNLVSNACEKWSTSRNGEYVKGYIAQKDGTKKLTPLHRLVTNASDGFVVDHINHNTLDNRKTNLRVCTSSQNAHNKLTATKKSTTGYLNVFWNKREKKYIVCIKKNKSIVFLERYKEISEAIKSSIEARAIYLGYSQEYISRAKYEN